MSLVDQEILICDGIYKKLKDMGDGTHAEVVIAVSDGSAASYAQLPPALGGDVPRAESLGVGLSSEDIALIESLKTSIDSLVAKTVNLVGGKTPVTGPITNAELSALELGTEAKQDVLIEKLVEVKSSLDLAIPLLEMAQAPEGFSMNSSTGDLLSFIRRLPNGDIKTSVITKTTANGVETFTPGAWL